MRLGTADVPRQVGCPAPISFPPRIMGARPEQEWRSAMVPQFMASQSIRGCMSKVGALGVFAISCSLTLDAGSAWAGKSARGTPSESAVKFTLKDFRGKEWSLSDFQKHKVVVVALLGTKCTIARLYATRSAQMADGSSERGVALLGVFPNRHDSITEMAQFALAHRIKFPLLKDIDQSFVDSLDADRVPEVIVLDKDRVVRYRGQIDDQYGYGVARPAAKQHYVVAAVTELLGGKSVTTTRTETVGCLIGRARTPDKDAKVTYSNQISRILNARCVRCHRKGEIAPFALTRY